MGFRLLLCLCALLCLNGYVLTEEPGTDFAFAFMQNFLYDAGDLQLEVLLTAFFPDTRATIEMPHNNYSEVVLLMPKFPMTVELPREAEVLYSTRSNNTVRITSNKPISVVATSSEYYRESVTVISPLANWGMDYYIVTPDQGPEDSFRQVAIVNGPQSNEVSILLTGLVEFEDTPYLIGEHFNLTLNPWETVQFQVRESLTGSHVLSQEPVALFSGRLCTEKSGKCQTCFQLPPVSAWGSNFASPPLPFQNVSSKIYILAASETEVNILHGFNMDNLLVTPGTAKELDFDPMMKLLISSPGKILVILCYGGGLLEPAEGFLINLLPRENACVSYSVVWVPGFLNVLLVAVQSDGREELQLNHEPLPVSSWKDILGTGLVYTLLPLNGSEYYYIHNTGYPFGVATIGTAEMSTYGAIGVCLDKVNHLCGFECPNELACPQSACRPPETQTCMAWGRTHFRTFQGTHYFQFGDCPSVLLSSQGVNSSFGSFLVARRPDHNVTVLLEVFEQRLEINAECPGTVLVNGELTYTPIFLDDGKLKITFQGLYFYVTTSFGMQILVGSHDGFVHIQMPYLPSGALSGLCVNQHITETEWPTSDYPIWSMQNSNFNCTPGSLICPTPCEDKVKSDLLALCHQMETSEIFQACHSTLDPKPFIESCELEVCETGDICLGLGAYALACGIESVNMTEWRSLSGCEQYTCPPNSFYSICAPSCPATCGIHFPSLCPRSCREGCVCNPGYISGNDGSCIPLEECMCSIAGQLLKEGDTFYKDDCRVACTCKHGKVVCASQPCPANESCQTLEGVTACYPKPVSCLVYGQKYQTFDGATLGALGDCSFTMVTTKCADNGTADLAVEFQISENVLLDSRSTIQSTRLEIHGHTVIIEDYSGEIQFDGITYPLPFDLENVIRVSEESSGNVSYIRVEAYPGITLIASRLMVWLTLPSSYTGNVCGLCGNANGNANDDTDGLSLEDFLPRWSSSHANDSCHTRLGLLKRDLNPYNLTNGDVINPYIINPYNLTDGEVINPYNLTDGAMIYSYNLTDGGVISPYNLTDGDLMDRYNLTAGNVTDLFNLTASCDVIVAADGAFSNCHAVTEPGWFFETCVNYASADLVQLVCETIKNYSSECQAIGVPVYHWENRTVCGSDGLSMSSEGPQAVLPMYRVLPSGRISAGARDDPHKLSCMYQSSSQNALPEVSADRPRPVECLLLLALVRNASALQHFSIRVDYVIGSQSEFNLVVKVYGLHIVIPRRMDQFLVNGFPASLPVSLTSDKVKMRFKYPNLVLETDFELNMTFSMGGEVFIQTPAVYRNDLYGWCGQPRSSSILPPEQYLCIQARREGWGCGMEAMSQSGCSLLLDKDGPFKGCQEIFPPRLYYEECQRLFCEGGNKYKVCEALQDYTRICRAQGAVVKPWRIIASCQDL